MTSNQEINWPELIAERVARGMPVEAFCKEKGVSKSRYYAMAHIVAKHTRSDEPVDTQRVVEVHAQEADVKQPVYSQNSSRVLTITTSWGIIEVPL